MAATGVGRKLLGFLGLANRAGKLAVGSSAIESLVRRGEKPLVVIASGISDGQRRKLKRLSPVSGFIEDVLNREDMAQAIGRSELVAVALSDPGFVKGILGLDLSKPAASADGDGRKKHK